MSKAVNKSTQKMQEFVHHVQQHLGWKDEDQTIHAICAVLQTLRDRLPLEDAVRLGDRLPTLLRGMYYENYKPAHKPDKLSPAQFYAKVNERIGNLSVNIEKVTHDVLAVVDEEYSLSSTDKVLPEEIRQLYA